MGRFRRSRGRGGKLTAVAFAAVSSGALAIGVTTSFGATPSTPYRTVGTDSPMPVDTSQTGVFSAWGVRLTASRDSTGDGIPDILVSGYTQDLPAAQVGGVANNNAGMVGLISGANQRVVWTASPEPQVNDTDAGFGFYISVADDLTGDGLEDFIASHPYHDIGANVDQGRVYVLNGKTGAVARTIESPDPQANGQFGGRIGTAGDVTGDGVADMLIGAPGHDDPAGCGNQSPVPANCDVDEGEAYIFNGVTGALVRKLKLPTADKDGCSPTGRCSFGGTVQSPGDINKDGWPDQTVAAYAWSPPGSGKTFVGRVYLFSGGGATAGQLLARIDPPGAPNGGFFGLEDHQRYAPGDLNGDGTNDLYFEAFSADLPGSPNAGQAWTYNGAATLASGNGVVLYELVDPLLGPNRAFGWADSQTDYNKDGRPDLLVSNLATVVKEIHVFEGSTGSELRRFSVPAADLAQEAGTGPALGWSSRAPGDLNGDCEPDYVAGAPYLDVGGQRDQGKVYFFLSSGPSACPSGAPAPPPGPGATAKRRPRLSLSVRKRVRRGRITLVASGRVREPGVAGAAATRRCGGTIALSVRGARNRRIVRTRTRVRRNCTFRKVVRFTRAGMSRRLGRRLARRTRRVRVVARYGGNAFLTPASRAVRVRIR